MTYGSGKAWHGGAKGPCDLTRLLPLEIWRDGRFLRQMEVGGAYWGGARDGGDCLIGRSEGDVHRSEPKDSFVLEDGSRMTLEVLKVYLVINGYY